MVPPPALRLDSSSSLRRSTDVRFGLATVGTRARFQACSFSLLSLTSNPSQSEQHFAIAHLCPESSRRLSRTNNNTAARPQRARSDSLVAQPLSHKDIGATAKASTANQVAATYNNIHSRPSTQHSRHHAPRCEHFGETRRARHGDDRRVDARPERRQAQDALDLDEALHGGQRCTRSKRW